MPAGLVIAAVHLWRVAAGEVSPVSPTLLQAADRACCERLRAAMGLMRWRRVRRCGELATQATDWLGTVTATLLGQRYFFATGHQAVISTIRWAPALAVLDHVHVVVSGVLVTAAFFAGPILGVLWALPPGAPSHAGVRVVAVRAALAAANMATTMVLRRHLMVWKIFAPRYARGRHACARARGGRPCRARCLGRVRAPHVGDGSRQAVRHGRRMRAHGPASLSRRSLPCWRLSS